MIHSFEGPSRRTCSHSCRRAASQLVWLLGWAVLATGQALAADEDVGVVAPEGFVVELFADDDLAHDIHSLTIDTQGRVVVSGPGYVRILLDTDGDGKADTAKQFADGPASGAQGMYFRGRDLLCTGDAGLIRYRDADRNDEADGPPDLFLKLRTGREHHAHAIRRGPDGWWYLLVGNMTDVGASYVTLPTSPIRHPENGVLLRLKPDLSGAEIICHGFRNAYDFDFNPQGDLFSFDSDDERDVSLPWYRPCRVFQLLPGSHMGWISTSWKRPDACIDMPPVIASFGRGSPTGMVCYRHTQFPEEYQGAVFALDWTFGRVWALPLQRAGATYRTKPIDFLTASGQFGFAPTDADVGPDGSLYVSVGGRGTRGGVFRVRVANSQAKAPGALPKEPAARLQAILDAPQPLSSWSRARWEPAARELREETFVQAALDESLTAAQRVRAIEILTDLFSGIGEDQVEKLAQASPPEVRARLAWAIERVPVKIDPTLTAKLIGDPDPLVKRQILEAVAMHPQFALPAPAGTFLPVLGDRQKFVRTAAARALAALNEDTFDTIGAEVRKSDWQGALTYAWGRNIRRGATEPKLDAYAIELGRLILEGRHTIELKRDAARLIQIGLGDMGSAGKAKAAFDGYSSPLDLSKYERELDPLRIALGKLYPTGDRELDMELGRLIAMLSPLNAELLTHVLAKITNDSDPIDDIHQLLIASRIPVQRSNPQQAAIAHALVQIEPKIAARKMGQDTNWEARFGELYEQLVELDPELPEKIVKDADFGRPGHVLFLTRAPSELIPDAVAAYSKRVAADPDFAWNNDVVFLFGMIDAAAYRKLVRDQYDRFAVRSAVVMTLAERPEPQDRPKFVEGLDSSQLEVLTACVGALEKLPADAEADENVALVRTLRRLGTEVSEYPARERVVKLLRRNSGKTIDFVFGEAGHKAQPEAVKAWTNWALENFPAKAAELQGGSEADLAMVRKLLDSTDFSKGDASRGRQVFHARGCIQCHGGSRGLGPDLAGVAGRFSREDLFIAIALPNRDVSPRYQTSLVVTKAGKTYSGMIIYESVDGVTLRNSTNQTFRLEADEIDSQRKLTTSLMPAGLLNGLSPSEVADLYSYLQGLASQTASKSPEHAID